MTRAALQSFVEALTDEESMILIALTCWEITKRHQNDEAAYVRLATYLMTLCKEPQQPSA